MGKQLVLTDAKRSGTMSRIKSQDTSIELLLRRALWREGVRYRKNDKRFPGTPDVVIAKYHIAVFCDGEFWHGKNWDEKKAKLKGNRAYWVEKIERNMSRDHEANRQLFDLGWTVIRFWGRDIHKNPTACVSEILDTILQSRIDADDDFEGLDEPWADLY